MRYKIGETETVEDARQGMVWLGGIESCAASDSMTDGNIRLWSL
jgi:hypothetical protein